jgi:hypothetical protein
MTLSTYTASQQIDACLFQFPSAYSIVLERRIHFSHFRHLTSSDFTIATRESPSRIPFLCAAVLRGARCNTARSTADASSPSSPCSPCTDPLLSHTQKNEFRPRSFDGRNARVGTRHLLITSIPMCLPRTDSVRLLAAKINKLVAPRALSPMGFQRPAFRLILKIFDTLCLCTPDFSNADTHSRIRN